MRRNSCGNQVDQLDKLLDVFTYNWLLFAAQDPSIFDSDLIALTALMNNISYRIQYRQIS
jgi:hypothetical protein